VLGIKGARKVDIRLPGNGKSTPLGARPVHQIFSMINPIPTWAEMGSNLVAVDLSKKAVSLRAGTFHTCATLVSVCERERVCKRYTVCACVCERERERERVREKGRVTAVSLHAGSFHSCATLVSV
jgi:hypothetical protein